MVQSRRYENSLIAILFFTWGTVFLDRMSQLYLAPCFAPEFHLSHEQVGTVASALAITWAASTLVFGALSDRVGRKPVLVPAVFAFSILSWASGLAHNFHQLLLVRTLMGAAGGPTLVHNDGADRRVFAIRSPGTKHRSSGQCGGTCRLGCSPSADNPSGGALGLAFGILRGRHSGIADECSALEVRGRASREERHSRETIVV
jgi:MFS family permease